MSVLATLAHRKTRNLFKRINVRIDFSDFLKIPLALKIVCDTVIFIVLFTYVELYDTPGLIVKNYDERYFCRVKSNNGIRPQSMEHILQTI